MWMDVVRTAALPGFRLSMPSSRKAGKGHRGMYSSDSDGCLLLAFAMGDAAWDSGEEKAGHRWTSL